MREDAAATFPSTARNALVMARSSCPCTDHRAVALDDAQLAVRGGGDGRRDGRRLGGRAGDERYAPWVAASVCVKCFSLPCGRPISPAHLVSVSVLQLAGRCHAGDSLSRQNSASLRRSALLRRVRLTRPAVPGSRHPRCSAYTASVYERNILYVKPPTNASTSGEAVSGLWAGGAEIGEEAPWSALAGVSRPAQGASQSG